MERRQSPRKTYTMLNLDNSIPRYTSDTGSSYTWGKLSHACSAARDHNWALGCAEVGTFAG